MPLVGDAYGGFMIGHSLVRIVPKRCDVAGQMRACVSHMCSSTIRIVRGLDDVDYSKDSKDRVNRSKYWPPLQLYAAASTMPWPCA